MIKMLKKKSKCSKTQKEKKNTETLHCKKRYLKSRPSCKVTFFLPREAVNGASRVTVVGDFNSWDKEASPLKKGRNGLFSTTIELASGKSYRYKYLLDDIRWENDWDADGYVPNQYGGDDSLVML